MTEKRFLSLDDLTHLPQPVWLIEGVMEVNSLTMLAGPPASFKSFLALDWLLCMATARPWNGRHTTPSKVLYVLGEGKTSLLKRIQVWAHYNHVTGDEIELLNENFRATFDVPQLASKASVDNMLAGLAAEGFKPEVIVIDTFARSFVGLDENSQQDTGLWIESADRLRQLGYTVIFLHHTKKNTEFGLQYRGSSAIQGAMDTAYTLSRDSGSDNRLCLRCTKQKDHDEGMPLYFNRIIIKLGNHDPEGSCVLIPAVMIDERFTPEYQAVDEKVRAILSDDTYESDRARARALAGTLGLSEAAAQSKISRRRRDTSELLPTTTPSADSGLDKPVEAA